MRSRIARLWRLEQLLWMSWALGWTTVSVAAISGLLAAVDYLWRSNDPGIRWILSLLWIAGSLAVVRFWHRRLQRRWPNSLTEWAERCEQLFPQLGSRLSTAAEFLTSRSAPSSYGSSQLQAALLEQVAAESATVPMQRALAWKTASRSLVVSAALLVVVAASARSSIWAATALRRLALPWSEVTWPQKDHLIVVDAPEAIGSGESFVIRVKNANRRLPRSVRFEMKPFMGSADVSLESIPSSTYLMSHDGKLAVLRLDGVMNSFAYRVTGGDDRSMPWRKVHVVEDPQWRITKRQVRPPEYTQLPPAESPAAIQAVEGSVVELLGKTARSIRSVAVVTDTAGEEAEIELQGSANGTRWQLPSGRWVLRTPGTYQIQFTDRSGFRWVNEPIPVDVFPDRAPTIDIAQPGAQELITVKSTVELVAAFSDDLGLKAIGWQILYKSQVVSERRLELLKGTTSSEKPVTVRREATIRDTWSADAAPLAENDSLAVVFFAEDSRGQRVEADARSLAVVSEKELTRRLQRLQDHIALRLGEALDAQRRAHDTVTAVQQSIDSKNDKRRANMAAARRIQATVGDLLWSSPRSATTLAHELEILIARHQLSAPVVRDLTQSFLRDAEQTAVPLEAQVSTLWPREVRESESLSSDLAELSTAQRKLAAWLHHWSERWNRQRDFAELRSKLDEVRRQQQQLLLETEQARLKSLAESSPSKLREQLDALKRRQDDLTRSFERWRADAESIFRKRGQAGADTLRQLDALGIGPVMAASGNELGARRIGAATASQRNAVDRLTSAADLLDEDDSNRSAEQSQRREALQALAAAIREWTQQEMAMRQATEGWLNGSVEIQAERLRARQQQIRLSVQLGTDQMAIHASLKALLRRVAGAMRNAEQALDSPTTRAALTAQDQALELLRAIAAALTVQQRSGETSQAADTPQQSGNNGLLPPPAVLKLLQEELLKETRELETERQSKGLTPQLARRIQHLAAEQASLAEWIAQALQAAAAQPTPPATKGSNE